MNVQLVEVFPSLKMVVFPASLLSVLAFGPRGSIIPGALTAAASLAVFGYGASVNYLASAGVAIAVSMGASYRLERSIVRYFRSRLDRN